ncbi:hypothetical protein [Leeuwenhoekiella sp. MAR_2009_132]|uniref:hypothetical protein n=1 Tax=Leeuwenhoekiella sp. MAR_2009_132 TaxID=1392489 RepID=UPI00048E8165|nr:hypothetical protein [Leeuwenhoekiella sp. MAR_2009_132]|tara:strand:- start:9321 stop:9596 length:276 start_codon:yes stop_codon:yes gene_type:complete
MKIYTGTIVEISKLDPDGTGHQKRKIQLEEEGNQISFIEFNGARMLAVLSEFKEGDNVLVAAVNKGSVSKSGARYNNIIAKSIKAVKTQLV